MATLFSWLRYLRLKFYISITRFLLKHLSPPIKPTPSSILAIPSRDQNRTIKAHLYKPPDAPSPSPVLLNFYGGGFALPLHGADDEFCHFIARNTTHYVLDIDYRVGPEDPFPAALHDAQDAALYVLANPDTFDSAHVSLAGFSSGATLALATAAAMPRGTFRALAAFYPATDLATDPGERSAPVQEGAARSPFWTRLFREAYVGVADARDPRISPAFAAEDAFPEDMIVVTADRDTSALEAEELGRKVGEGEGRNVVVRRMEGCGHAFDKKAKSDMEVRAKNESYGLVVDMLKGIL